MANLPTLTVENVAAMLPQASAISLIGSGGQKLVFRAAIEGQNYAVKFAKLPAQADGGNDFSTTDISLRAKREVETMRDCHSPYMVKLGPVGLSFNSIGDQNVLFFSEELIEGRDLHAVFKTDGRLSPNVVTTIGRHITSAIKSLWELGKIHRDIKPANIMERSGGEGYVLLDAGLAFDIAGESLSITPVGTPAFFSPEQFEFNSRRTVLDFRSDIFSLGVTLYFLSTGQHPFWTPGDSPESLYSRITSHIPTPPSELVSGFPANLEDVILRMMGKSPHLRFRKCDQLIEAFEKL